MAATARPTEELALIQEAYELFDASTANVTDAMAAEPSGLPGWTRGHVLNHVARSSEGYANAIETVLAGGEGSQYPGGEAGREADIEAGSSRSVAELRSDIAATHVALTAAFAKIPDDGWDRTITSLSGPRTMTQAVHWRVRELLIHLVDLDVGVAPADLPPRYLLDDADWIRQWRPDWTLPE